MNQKALIEKLISKIKGLNLDITVMHVCGTHQESLMKSGLMERFEDAGVRIIQGPGCPVCVTSPGEIEEILAIARSGVHVCAFGDMMRVPGPTGSLNSVRAEGFRVDIVYSIEDAVNFAQSEPVVFMGIGFETTAPSSSVIIKKRPENFSVLSCHRIIPPALKFIAESGEVNIQGLIEPGHVSAIIGTEVYEPISKKYGLPQVVAGFEPLDLVTGVYMLAKQVSEGRAQVENQYTRVVKREGNPTARKLMNETFTEVSKKWRGFPEIPGSVLEIRSEYSEHNAREIYSEVLDPLKDKEFGEPAGCLCGEVLRGVESPENCPLFGGKCRPDHPIGPCMVSREGNCNIAYRFGQ